MGTELSGKIAIVTGAGSGIGAATAKALAAEDAAVAAVDINEAGVNNTCLDITATGARSLPVVCDVSQADGAERAVHSTIAAFGGVDILVNNAGIARYGTVVDMSEDEWDAVVGTNLKGPFLMAKMAIPEIRQRGGGAIVNTASVQAFASQALVPAYSASKGGVVALTKAMAIDHAPDNIRVNAIAPGSVETGMLRAAAELFVPDDQSGAMESWGKLHPIGYLAQPEEVADVIVFLVSHRSRYVTGTVLVVDGGLLAKLGV
jgi:NAD(P)-dependent dehydrogenase (short-subunit alcohol dehydrogenase family)